jgi:predicted HicB family RNase H-like nuclease
MTETDRAEEVRRAAAELFARAPDWVTFFREVLGLEGIVRRCYPTPQSLAEFEQTDTYVEVQQMLTKLREREAESRDREGEPFGPQEQTKVITVRLPKSLHEALRAEAHDHRTSMNKLCISKLLQFIDNQFVPAER